MGGEHGAKGDRRWPLPPFRADPGSAEIVRLVAAGDLRRVVLDVHAAASARQTFSLRLAALRLLVPARLADTGAVVCLRTALWLYAGGAAPARVDLALPGPTRRTRAPEISLHAIPYGPADLWAALPDFAVTSPARTAADVAGVLPRADAVCALAVLGVATGLRPMHVTDALARSSGRPGVARARQVVHAWGELWDAPVPPEERATASVDGSVDRSVGRSVDPVARHPVGVEHALDPPDRADHVVEMTGGGHLEGEPGHRDAVA
jgi:hypothetical protein